MNDHRRERGQVLVLIILAIVGLFGLLALAVDGGRIYAERRRAQAAADSGALAAAFSALMGENEATWRSEAMAQINLNGYDDTDSADNGKEIDVMIYSPPLDGATNPARYDDRPWEYIQVIIRTKVDPVFSQIVFGGPISMEVEAVAQATTYLSAYPGKALVAIGESVCPGAKFSGTGDTIIHNGSIYVHGSQCGSCDAIERKGNGLVDVNNGSISTPGCINKGSKPDLMTADKGIFEKADRLAIPPFPVPDCNNILNADGTTSPMPTRTAGSSPLLPGKYPGGIKITGSKSDVKLEPGMYCLYNDFVMNGGRITGEGVIIVMMKGKVSVSGNAIVHLSAPEKLLDGSKQNWGGMLFYMPSDNSSDITLNGGGNSNYTGTVYAPGPSSKTKCKINGNSDSIAYNTAVICWDIDVGGTADLNIYYQEKQQYRPPPALHVTR